MRKVALLTLVLVLAASVAACAGGEEADETPPSHFCGLSHRHNSNKCNYHLDNR